MIERLVHKKENRRPLVNWAIEMLEGWTLFPIRSADLDPNLKIKVHPGYPPIWMTDESLCALCCKGFGPDRCFHLGTCGHMYHVPCLMHVAICKPSCMYSNTPFPRRLYEMFGIAYKMSHVHKYN